MRKFILSIALFTVQLNLQAGPDLRFVNAGSVSIFQPVFANDTSATQKMFLFNQEIKADIFPGYVVVRADYWFNNQSDKTVTLLAGFPECKSFNSDCSRLSWLRVMINNGAPNAPTMYTDDSLKKISNEKILDKNHAENWQAWSITFLPGVTQVTLNYGIQTANAMLFIDQDSVKGNAFRYSFSNYKWWNAADKKGDIWMRMNGGYITKDIFGLLPDKKFVAGNSIVHAAMKDVMNDSSGEVLLWYRNLDSSDFNLSSVSWETHFYKVNSWTVNENLLRTLSPFSATDFSGKSFHKSLNTESSLLTWSAIAGAAIVTVFLLFFIYAERKKTAQ